MVVSNDKQQQQQVLLPPLLQQVARYYEQSRAWTKAGRLYARMNQPAQALPLLLQGNSVEEAIQVVVAGCSSGSGEQQQQQQVQQQAQQQEEAQVSSSLLLIQSLVAHLSEEEGPGKDLTSLGRLYMALGR